MAIIYPVLGRMKGSLGNITTRKHYASASRVIASQKANVVKNPKSLAQAQQRLKLAPLVKVYSRLHEIICHSFQGLTYGMSNYAAYLKANMNGFEGPYVIKGAKIAVPGTLVISRGSLQGVSCSVAGENPILFNTDIKCGSLVINSSTTVGDIADSVIAANSNIENGDQLTFVGCIHIQNRYDWNFERIVLDTSDTTLLADKEIAGLLNCAGGVLTFTPYTNLTTSEPIICGGVIVSRYSTSQKIWLRSNCTLDMFELSDTYFGAAAYKNAVDSYRGNEVAMPTSSTWYLNGGNVDNAYGFYAITPMNEELTLGGATSSNIAVGISASGKNKMFYTKSSDGNTFILEEVLKGMLGKSSLTTTTLAEITTLAEMHKYEAMEITSEQEVSFSKYIV